MGVVNLTKVQLLGFLNFMFEDYLSKKSSIKKAMYQNGGGKKRSGKIGNDTLYRVDCVIRKQTLLGGGLASAGV